MGCPVMGSRAKGARRSSPVAGTVRSVTPGDSTTPSTLFHDQVVMALLKPGASTSYRVPLSRSCSR